jgi:hypothetical protein
MFFLLIFNPGPKWLTGKLIIPPLPAKCTDKSCSKSDVQEDVHLFKFLSYPFTFISYDSVYLKEITYIGR